MSIDRKLRSLSDAPEHKKRVAVISGDSGPGRIVIANPPRGPTLGVQDSPRQVQGTFWHAPAKMHGLDLGS